MHFLLFVDSNINIANYDTTNPAGGTGVGALGSSGSLSNYTISGSGTSIDPLLISFEHEFSDTYLLTGHLPTSNQIVTCYMNPLPLSSSIVQGLSDAESISGMVKVVSTFFDETDPIANASTSSAQKFSIPAMAALIIVGLLSTF